MFRLSIPLPWWEGQGEGDPLHPHPGPPPSQGGGINAGKRNGILKTALDPLRNGSGKVWTIPFIPKRVKENRLK